ncbi:MAG: hypothetical protein AVDCRST_MAG66-1598, partial [uncultured Pseudonocardia sp.]
ARSHRARADGARHDGGGRAARPLRRPADHGGRRGGAGRGAARRRGGGAGHADRLVAVVVARHPVRCAHPRQPDRCARRRAALEHRGAPAGRRGGAGAARRAVPARRQRAGAAARRLAADALPPVPRPRRGRDGGMGVGVRDARHRGVRGGRRPAPRRRARPADRCAAARAGHPGREGPGCTGSGRRRMRAGTL